MTHWPMRRRGKGMSFDGLRDLLKDDRLWTVGGLVAVHPGETSHWEINPDGDVEVTVLTHNGKVPVRAILGGMGPAWYVPDVGTEMVVHFHDGDFEGTAVAYVMRDGAAPSDLSGGVVVVRAGTKVHVVAPNVTIDDGSGGAAAVATKADVVALRNFVAGHDHPFAGTDSATDTFAGTTGGPNGVTPTPAGTLVLEAK